MTGEDQAAAAEQIVWAADFVDEQFPAPWIGGAPQHRLRTAPVQAGWGRLMFESIRGSFETAATDPPVESFDAVAQRQQQEVSERQ